MIDNLQCPADQVMINENKVRIVAFFVLILSATYVLTGYLIIPMFLSIDFFLRAFNLGAYSLASLLADGIVSLFKIKNKPTDRAPKRFATGVGFAFAAFILIAALLNWYTVGIAITIILVFFAGLESLLNFCAGCYVYSILQNISGKFSTLKRL